MRTTKATLPQARATTAPAFASWLPAGRLDWASQTAVLALSVLFLLPLVWLVASSLKTLTEATAYPPRLLPDTPQFQNYSVALRQMGFLKYLVNTVVICALNVVGTTAASALVAWGIAQYRWAGTRILMVVTLATMMVPFPVLMVPQYVIFKELGLIGTTAPLWITGYFGVAYNIFLLHQFLRGIPQSLIEAARVDGCSEVRIFLQIVAPLSRSALLVVALFTFMFHWNDFMGPLLYLTNETQFTLALGLQAFQSRLGGVEVNLLMAATTVMILPIMVLFFFTQRFFLDGIALTGSKE